MLSSLEGRLLAFGASHALHRDSHTATPIGFDANEQARAEKDRLYDNDVRAGRLVPLAGLGLGPTRGLPALPASCPSRALWTPAAVCARL